MLDKVLDLYGFIFSRRMFINFNKLLLNFGLRGLGILNYKNLRSSGEQNFLSNILDEDGLTVFDVGAYTGEYSKCAKQMNPTTKVYAFEPHPKTHLRLQENAQHCLFKAFNFGFGERAGTQKLYDYANNDGSSHASLCRDVIRKIHKSEEATHDVFIETLDDFVGKENIKMIDLLKIDAEGNELKVLLGAKRMLREGKIHVIQFEFSQLNIMEKNSFLNFCELLSEYKIFRILKKGLMELEPYNPMYCEIYLFQNVVAVHKKCLDDFIRTKVR